MTKPIDDTHYCHLCQGLEFRISVCDSHLAKLRDGFATRATGFADGIEAAARLVLDGRGIFGQGREHIAATIRALAIQTTVRATAATDDAGDPMTKPIDDTEAGTEVFSDFVTRRLAAARAAGFAECREEAAAMAEDWTCRNCDSDTAHDLAAAILALKP